MQCNDVSDVLVDFIDGRLDPAQERDVERHLDSVCELPGPGRGSPHHPRGGVHARQTRTRAGSVDLAAATARS
jgi:hypothetical protein